MTEILARLRVRETHGIRRFLYPLSAEVNLPEGSDTAALSLASAAGKAVPLQVTPCEDGQYRVDFAISLEPFQGDTELRLIANGPQAAVPDPLQLTCHENGTLRSVQERFEITLGPAGEISAVIYDTVPHLNAPAVIQRLDSHNKNYERGLIPLEQASIQFQVAAVKMGSGPLCAWSQTKGSYSDGSAAEIRSEITACKSWVRLHYRLEQPCANDTVTFHLPLTGDSASTHPSRTIFDTGINGIYGQVDEYGAFLNWVASPEGDTTIKWEIGKQHIYEDGRNLSRTDYQGEVDSEEAFQQQRWFHFVEDRKAVAVAITKMPTSWKSLEISLRRHLSIKFILTDAIAGPAEFGICCHFLNDIPAIAAATNPQSILLPPTVTVLPV